MTVIIRAHTDLGMTLETFDEEIKLPEVYS